MAKTKRSTRAPQQLNIQLSDRRPLAGLSARVQAELLDVIAQLLLQAERLDRPGEEKGDE